jgi:hypothetical protein
MEDKAIMSIYLVLLAELYKGYKHRKKESYLKDSFFLPLGGRSGKARAFAYLVDFNRL